LTVAEDARREHAMKKTPVRIVTAFAGAGALFLVCRSWGDPGAVLNYAGQAALDKREAVKKKCAADYQAKLIAADTQLSADLDKLIRQARQAGAAKDVIETDAIKTQVELRLRDEKLGVLPADVSLNGTWSIRTPRGTSTWTITDTQVDVDHGGDMKDSGPATIVDGSVMVHYPNGWLERFTPMGDRLFFENWDPKIAKDYKTIASTDLGIGTRVTR
jgi:hypothetical protein